MTNRRMQGLLEWLDGERLVASGHRAATIENHLKNALEVDKILNERPPSSEMVMVPREPTVAQKHLAMMNDSPSYRTGSLTFYRAMLSAAEAEGRKGG